MEFRERDEIKMCLLGVSKYLFASKIEMECLQKKNEEFLMRSKSEDTHNHCHCHHDLCLTQFGGYFIHSNFIGINYFDL